VELIGEKKEGALWEGSHRKVIVCVYPGPVGWEKGKIANPHGSALGKGDRDARRPWKSGR